MVKTNKSEAKTILLKNNIEISDFIDNKILIFLLKTTVGQNFPKEGITNVALGYKNHGRKGTFFNIKGININSVEELADFIINNLKVISSNRYDSINIRYK